MKSVDAAENRYLLKKSVKSAGASRWIDAWIRGFRQEIEMIGA